MAVSKNAPMKTVDPTKGMFSAQPHAGGNQKWEPEGNLKPFCPLQRLPVKRAELSFMTSQAPQMAGGLQKGGGRNHCNSIQESSESCL